MELTHNHRLHRSTPIHRAWYPLCPLCPCRVCSVPYVAFSSQCLGPMPRLELAKDFLELKSEWLMVCKRHCVAFLSFGLQSNAVVGMNDMSLVDAVVAIVQ